MMRKPIVALLLASVLLLASCTSPLIESGTDMNSKVSKSIDGYELITAERAAETGFCTGNPSDEQMSTETEHIGTFLYLESGHQLSATGGECNNRDLALTLADGVVQLFFISYDAVEDSSGERMAGLFGESCETLEAYEELMSCRYIVENTNISVVARQNIPEEEFRDKYQSLARKFAEQSDFHPEA